MNHLLRILWILCTISASIWVASTGCSQQPECRTDGDCIESVGAEFLCFELKCRKQSVVYRPRPPKPEPKPEAGPEAKPDEPSQVQDEKPVQDKAPERTPEPVKETPPVEFPPDAGQLPVGAPCENSGFAGPKEQCAPGLICARFDSFSAYCLQDCSSNSSRCSSNTDGRTTCMQVGWTQDSNPEALKVCAKLAKKDEPCNAQQSLFCEWKTGNDHLICLKGKCTQGKLCTSVGCSCSFQSVPPVACDITKKLVCDHGSNQCALGVRAHEGEACSEIKGTKRYCDIDHACVTYGGGVLPDICLKICDLGQPKASCNHRAPKSFKCFDIQGKGKCIQDNCSKQGDCAFQEYSHLCKVQGSSRTCSPLPLPGSRKFGQTCLSNGQKDTVLCAQPFLCLASYCSIQCNSNTDCQMFDPKAQCILKDNTTGVNFCGYRCTGGCPPNMKCQQGQTFCVGIPPTP